ncbi:hypothetical protein DOTSEDRAFT_26582 [Dothistroma septosporum NZE10]|uniref:Uncharacterized protein n=1 Tax=Dothistroma septosporum (strain NZE10 / CBS 128990) TaxID=675120 RepID=N1PIN4_DOTSN|nr:hypothetical protein DOTSEDRAFT_26582 [Dothistroma septosporum NZE10]
MADSRGIQTVEQWNRAQKNGKQSYLYEEQQSEYDRIHGGLKTRNPLNDPWQRSAVYTTSNERSPFRKSVSIAICAHGEESSASTTIDLSLIVFHVKLSCAEEKRYKSARLDFKFAKKDPSDLTAPEVVNWGPFMKEKRGDGSQEGVTTTKSIDGSLGVDQHAKGELSAGIETTLEYSKRYFKKSFSEAVHDDESGKDIGVRWHFAQNYSQNDGVDPDFHVAILVKPGKDKDGKARPFLGSLGFRLNAGVLDDVKQGIERFFASRNDPVWYDPKLAMQSYITGDRVKEDVAAKLMNLGVYKKEVVLSELVANIDREATT